MGKSRRAKRYDETDEERQERLLDQVKKHGRQQTPPPGFYHENAERPSHRKGRKGERDRLRHMRDEYNG